MMRVAVMRVVIVHVTEQLEPIAFARATFEPS